MKAVLLLAILTLLISTALVFFGSDDKATRTIHLAGDSTMANQVASNRPHTGWGEPLGTMLCDDIHVVNHARNGRSTKSFLSEGHWDDLVAQLRVDDVVMIQFGHNDQKIDNPSLYAASSTDYTDNLQQFVNDVRTQGAKPVLLTSIVRRAFTQQGKLQRTLGDYPDSMRRLASSMKVDIIDLNAMTRELVETIGPVHSRKLYVHLEPGTHKNHPAGIKDNTHLSAHGASQVASLVAAELQKTHLNLVCE